MTPINNLDSTPFIITTNPNWSSRFTKADDRSNKKSEIALARALESYPKEKLNQLLAAMDSFGIIDHCPSVAELAGFIYFLENYPFDHFLMVGQCLKEHHVIEKCGLGNHLEFLFQFTKSYDPETLLQVMSTLQESGVIAKCQNGEEVAYLLKDLAPDQFPSFPIHRLPDLARAMQRHGLVQLCEDGVQIRDLLKEVRYFDFKDLENHRSPLPKEFPTIYTLLACAETPDPRVVAIVIQLLGNTCTANQFLEQLRNNYGAESVITSKHVNIAIQQSVGQIIQELKPHFLMGQSLPQEMILRIEMKLQEIAVVDSWDEGLRVLKLLTDLKSLPSLTIREACSWLIESEAWNRLSKLDEFHELLIIIHQFSQSELQLLLTMLQQRGMINFCKTTKNITTLLKILKTIPNHFLESMSEWFANSTIISRCIDFNALEDNLNSISFLVDRGATVNGKGISGIDVSTITGNDERTRSARLFYQVETNYQELGEDWVYTPAFGRLIENFYQRKYVFSLTSHTFSNLPVTSPSSTIAPTDHLRPPAMIIHNNHGYGQTDSKKQFRPGDRFMQGKALIRPASGEDKIEDPIGYNIHLPLNKPVRAIIVSAYGGFGTLAEAYLPGELSAAMSKLLERGIAQITLNLVDLLRLKVFQANMPKPLHSQLHACIDVFHKTLRENPESLHKDLEALKGKKIYLYGASFGGRTAVRQAQKYPKTYDGYISHDGAVSTFSGEIDCSDLKEIEAIDQNDRILLLQNYDDNIVGVYESLSWHIRATRLNKDVQLVVFDRGNPFPKKGGKERDKSADEMRDNDCYKGHFQPTTPHNFKYYVDTIEDFTTGDKSLIPELGKWRQHTHGNFSGSYNQVAIFLSKALRIFKDDRLHGNPSELRPKDIQNPEKREEAWKTFFEPLLRSVCYASQVEEDGSWKKEALSPEMMTDERVERALVTHLPTFIEYLVETERGLSSVSYDPFKLQSQGMNLMTPGLREKFRELIENEKSEKYSKWDRFVTLLLQSWFTGNPTLVMETMASIDPETLAKAKEQLFEVVDVDLRLMRTIFRKKILSALQ